MSEHSKQDSALDMNNINFFFFLPTDFLTFFSNYIVAKDAKLLKAEMFKYNADSLPRTHKSKAICSLDSGSIILRFKTDFKSR